jgi:hypothetical protein
VRLATKHNIPTISIASPIASSDVNFVSVPWIDVPLEIIRPLPAFLEGPVTTICDDAADGGAAADLDTLTALAGVASSARRRFSPDSEEPPLSDGRLFVAGAAVVAVAAGLQMCSDICMCMGCEPPLYVTAVDTRTHVDFNFNFPPTVFAYADIAASVVHELVMQIACRHWFISICKATVYKFLSVQCLLFAYSQVEFRNHAAGGM